MTNEFRDQTGAGDGADHPRRDGEGPGRLGGRRRGLRRRPDAAATIRGHGLGYVLRRRRPTGACPPQAGPIRVDGSPPRYPPAWQKHSAGTGSNGRADLLVGLGRPAPRRRHRHRSPSPADPPQRCHRRAGLPALLRPRPGPAAHPGAGGRATLADRGSPSRPPRASPGWTSTRSAAGPPGTAGPPWPCSRTPSWPWPPPTNATPNRHQLD